VQNQENKNPWQKKRQELGGFTLVEVALSIAMGLIIIASALMAFNITKRNSIQAQQSNEAAAMKAIVETAVAKGTFPSWTNSSMVVNSFFGLVTKAATNPYSGTPRIFSASGIGSFTTCTNAGTTTSTISLYSPLASVTAACGNTAGGGTAGSASNIMGGFLYAWTTTNPSLKVTVISPDSTTKTYDGWGFVETDMSGNIQASSGGGIGTSESSG